MAFVGAVFSNHCKPNSLLSYSAENKAFSFRPALAFQWLVFEIDDGMISRTAIKLDKRLAFGAKKFMAHLDVDLKDNI
jgi:hypothetical protein